MCPGTVPNVSRDESGATLVESAIILPFLVLMVVATFDLGAALNHYLILNRIVYEGTRYAATIPGLKTGEFNNVSLNPEKHADVRDRIVSLISTSELVRRNGYTTGEFEIVTKNSANNWITVTLTVHYHSIFGFFNQMPIKISATGPYLSQTAKEVYGY